MAATPQAVLLPAAVEQLIEAVLGWAGGRPDLRSVILLGSYARGAPTGRALDELIREANRIAVRESG